MNGNTSLSKRERLFCFYRGEGRDARGAAAAAGYAVFPEKAAAKLLAREEITREIGRLRGGQKDYGDEAAAGYRRLAFGSVTDALKLLFAEEKPAAGELEAMDLFLVSDIKRPKGGGLEIKFFDRLKALERLRECGAEKQADDGARPFYEALERGARALAGEGGL